MANPLVISQLQGMNAVRDRFNQHLLYNPQSSQILWKINTREDLFKHIASVQSHFNARNTHMVRVDGILKSLDGFVVAVQSVDSAEKDEWAPWKPMIWGSSALNLAQLYERTAGHEQILTLLEDLTTTTVLPSDPIEHSESFVVSARSFLLQLFAELSNGLLNLAMSLQGCPQGELPDPARHQMWANLCVAPQKKTIKFTDFELEHRSTVQRVRSWAAKLYQARSSAGPPVPRSVELIRQTNAAIPVHINRNFCGRQDKIGEIHACFQSAVVQPATVCIHGLPGIGKTQLSAQYWRVFGSEYAVSMWVEADTRTKLLSAFSKYALQLKIEGTFARANQFKNAQLLSSWLQTTDVQWLLIFDNVDDVHCLDDLWPSGGNGNIIITSRSPYTSEFRSSATIRLLPLSQDESRELFYKIIGEHQKSQHCGEIEQTLAEWKGVPLAVNHIGSYIRRMRVGIHRFVKLYQKSPVKMLQTENETDSYPHSVATAFSVHQLDPKPKALLQAFCFLDPDVIVGELFLSRYDEGHSFGMLENELEYYDSLRYLCKSGLTYQSEELISTHRLVQAIVYSGMGDDDRVRAFTDVLEIVNAAFPRETVGKPMWENWARCDRCLPHVMFLCKRYEELTDKETHCAELASLLGACTWYMFERGLFTEAEPLAQLAQICCPDSPASLLTLGNILFSLGGIRFECNRIKESLSLCSRVLEIRENMLDPLDPLLGNTLYSMGIVYMEDDQLEKALDCHLRSVKIHKACQESGKHDGSPTAFAYMDLALCYWKMGALVSASEFVEKAVALFKNTSGPKSQKYGQAMYALGTIREAQNRTGEARKAYKVSLEVCQSITPTHFKTGLGLHKMASFMHREGDYDGALTNLQNALSILEDGFDPIPRVARTVFKISEVLQDMGRKDEATVKRREAARLRGLIDTFLYDPALTAEAFDSLIPSFLR